MTAPSNRVSSQSIADTVRNNLPGAMIAFIIAAAAHYISSRLGGPVMLYALLFGISLNFLSADEKCMPGICLASTSILRIGVALLGLQITWMEVASLGISTIILVISGVALTITIGVAIGRLLKLERSLSFLTAGAVAICGASAALAISSVLPSDNGNKKSLENNTLITVVGVTALSTMVMVLYPVIIEALGLDNKTAGIFLGATIHDVAQVIGAGYMVSQETGEVAAIVKLLRVACLVPVVMTIGFIFRKSATANGGNTTKTPIVPLFLVGFIVCVAIHSMALLPSGVEEFLADTSRWFLITAVAALGMKTSLEKFFSLGLSPVLALVAQTVFLATFVLAALTL